MLLYICYFFIRVTPVLLAFICVYAHGYLALYNFVTWVGLCIHHHYQDTGQLGAPGWTQSIMRLTLDFSSGHGLMNVGSSPTTGCALTVWSLLGILSLPLCLPLPCSLPLYLSLSLSLSLSDSFPLSLSK